ncbi:interleukin-17C [Rhinatrema bivittatum]|uniref:interleukin-17C n=1 Tax=Rhinatrema bivittatum TaxID=194408 RepID=UPI0011294004|nr:interleukin-17C [Rhinatrema bivittatum]
MSKKQCPRGFLRLMECPIAQGLLCALLLSFLGACQAQKRLKHGGPQQHHQLCFSPEELQEGSGDVLQHFVGRNLRWDKFSSVTLVEHLEAAQRERGRRQRRHQEQGCPNLQLPSGSRAELSQRSISPWRYRIDVDEDRYPQKLAFAQCLCSGCIDARSGKETSSLNSVAVEQTLLVLRRKPCARLPGAFTFEPDYIKVPVGCTCAVPRH